MQESLLKYEKEALVHKNDELKWKEVKLSDIIKHTMTKGECMHVYNIRQSTTACVI